ncbi:MAG: PAAR-like domain-containing protein, partial [Pseudomonadota bacterium]
MRNYTARQNGRQRVICLCPSINKTQIGNVVVPIPYPVQQSLAKAKKVSRNVRFNRDQAFTSASHTRKVTGDAPGRLKGIISNT